jgi:hypothetical protein
MRVSKRGEHVSFKMILVLGTLIVAILMSATGCPQPKNTTPSVTTTEISSTAYDNPTITVSYDFGDAGWVE